MQTAYNAVRRAALVILHKLRIDTRFAVPLLVIRLYKIPPCILEYLRLDDQ